MECNNLLIDLRQPLDVDAVAKREPSFKLLDGVNVLEAKAGSLLITAYPNGWVRIAMPGAKFSDLNLAVGRSALALSTLLQKLAAAAKIEGDASALLSSPQREEAESDTLASLIAVPLRKSFKDANDSAYYLADVLAASQVLSPFQAERFHTQVGENLGRTTVAASKPKSPAAVFKALNEVMAGTHLGSLESDSSSGFQHQVTVKECYCTGSPAYGFALCGVVRGLLRGAFAQYYGQENVSAEESECWGLGHSGCKFIVRILSK